MTTSKRRLKKIEISLTPKEAVLLWLKNATTQAEDWTTYIADRFSRGEKPPRDEIADQIEGAIHQAMKGEKADQVDQAIRQAVREGDFLFMLFFRVNIEVMAESKANMLQVSLLAEQIQGIFERDSFSDEKRISDQTRVADWRARALSYTGEIYCTQATIEVLERRYFDGASILVPDVADELQHQLEMLRQIISVYNDTIQVRLDRYQDQESLAAEKPEADDERPSSLRSGFWIDLDEVRRIVQPHIHKKVQGIAAGAEIESLAGIGEPGDVLRLYGQLMASLGDGQ